MWSQEWTQVTPSTLAQTLLAGLCLDGLMSTLTGGQRQQRTGTGRSCCKVEWLWVFKRIGSGHCVITGTGTTTRLFEGTWDQVW